MASTGFYINDSLTSSPLTVGTHILVNVYDITEQNTALLTTLEVGRPVLDNIVRELQFHVVAQAGHQFSPMGYSYAYVLSESHFTIHTYPEHRSCYIDMFCCNPSFDTDEAVRCIQRAFHTENVKYKVIKR